jgi:hypothetical protein
MKQATTKSVRVFAGKGAIIRVKVPSMVVPRTSVGSYYCCCGDGQQPK